MVRTLVDASLSFRHHVPRGSCASVSADHRESNGCHFQGICISLGDLFGRNTGGQSLRDGLLFEWRFCADSEGSQLASRLLTEPVRSMSVWHPCSARH